MTREQFILPEENRGEGRLDSIKQQIFFAVQEAPQLEEVNSLIATEVDLTRRLVNQDLTKEEYYKQWGDIERLPGQINCSLLSDFVDLVRTTGQIFGTPEDITDRIIAHENNHRSKAEGYGLDSGYAIQFYKVGDKVGIRPSVWFKLPPNATIEDQQQITKDILSAPEYLSASDIDKLS